MSSKRTLDYISILCIEPNEKLQAKCETLLIEQKSDKNASHGGFGEFKATEITHLGEKSGVIAYGKTHGKFWVKIMINKVKPGTLNLLDQKINEVLLESPYMIEDYDLRLLCKKVRDPVSIINSISNYAEELGFNKEVAKYQGIVRQVGNPFINDQPNPNAFINNKRMGKRGRGLLLYAARKDKNDRGVSDEVGNQFDGTPTHLVAEIKNRKQHMGKFVGGGAWRTLFVPMVRERLNFLTRPFRGKGKNSYNHFTFKDFDTQLSILAAELTNFAVVDQSPIFYVQDIVTGRPNQYRKKLASLSLMMPYVVTPVVSSIRVLCRFDLREFHEKRALLPGRYRCMLNSSSKACVNEMTAYYLRKGDLNGFWAHWLIIQLKRRSERLNVPIDEIAGVLKALFKDEKLYKELNWMEGAWIKKSDNCFNLTMVL